MCVGADYRTVPRTIEISDEDVFQKLIDEHAWLGEDVETRIMRLMHAGDLWLTDEPYIPNERHGDCLLALTDALRARYEFEQIGTNDLLYACAVVALSRPDDVAKELLRHEEYAL